MSCAARRLPTIALIAMLLGCGSTNDRSPDALLPDAVDRATADPDAGRGDLHRLDAERPDAARDAWPLAACCPGGDAGCTASSGRLLRCHAAGGRVESYPGNAVADQRLDALVVELAACPLFADFLAEILVVIAPPDSAGLEGLPEFGAGYEQAEGAAVHNGLNPGDPPTLVIASSSLRKWHLGAVHELVHLLHLAKLTRAEMTLIDETYATVSPDPELCKPPLLPCNAHELFAYTGQWFLAGYGDYLEQQSVDPVTQKSAIAEMHRAILGACRVSVGWPGLSEAEIRSLIDWVLEIYRP